MKIYHHRLLASATTLAVAAIAGCRSTPPDYEKEPRGAVSSVADTLTPDDGASKSPVLTETSPISEYMRFALLRHPYVKAAFQEWRASVEVITPAHALPDPRLTFEADVTNALMTFMPGLMFDFMGPGKRDAMGREAAAGSGVLYRAYATTLLTTAGEVRKAWVDLSYAGEVVALRREAVVLSEQSSTVAETEYTTGAGMVSLEKQTALLSQTALLKAELATDEDRLVAARARFKAALGLRREESDPPWPAAAFPSPPPINEEALWRQLIEANPRLASMRAMVDMTIASVEVADKAGIPDYSLGVMTDLKASPIMVRPTASMTLPVWRDKIDAILASAKARQLAAEARVDAEQVALAAELAQTLFMVREAERMSDYLDRTALPNATRAIASSEAGYQSGMGGFSMLAGLRTMELGLRMERVAARRQREAALADLSQLVADKISSDGLTADTSSSK